MKTNTRPKPSPRRQLRHGGNPAHRTTTGADLEFGRFRVLLRRRQLLGDGVPVELGARAFDVMLALLEADGSLVTKEELMSRAWPAIVVSEGNLEFQVSALRKALGADRDLIRTEFGRGYRFISVLRVNNATAAPDYLGPERLRSARILFPHSCRRSFRSVNWAACPERGPFSGLDTIGG